MTLPSKLLIIFFPNLIDIHKFFFHELIFLKLLIKTLSILSQFCLREVAGELVISLLDDFEPSS